MTTEVLPLIECMAMNESDAEAWLETKLGIRIPISATCSIGRSKTNSIVIPSERISRRHALIHLHGDGEYLLIDMGSSNGTVLNGHRIEHMTVLHDGDLIEIGPTKLLFRSAESEAEQNQTFTDESSPAVVPCWLLVAASQNANLAKYEIPVAESLKTIAAWPLNCEREIRRCGGIIARQSGEDMFAYWPEGDVPLAIAQKVLNAVALLQRQQNHHCDRFRLALHYAKVIIEPSQSQAYNTLEGGGVKLVFHLQRLVWLFPTTCLLSKAAALALATLASPKPLYLADNGRTTQPLFTL